MGWKNWSSWLKGGIIGIVIFLILLALSVIIDFPRGEFGNIFEWILMWLGVPIIMLARVLFSIEIGPPLTNFYIIMIPYSFIVGVIIGLIVEKIKSRK